MIVFIPKTRNQWIAVGALAVAVLCFLYFFTDTFRGQAVEVSVENASVKPIFAYIDNTGRHGKNTATDVLPTTTSEHTPSGLLIQPGKIRSFGTAIGLGDSPTLHVLAITDEGMADTASMSDCVFDTISLKKLEIPSQHIKIKWSGTNCDLLQ